jgi:hypothetical protein
MSEMHFQNCTKLLKCLFPQAEGLRSKELDSQDSVDLCSQYYEYPYGE